MSTDPSVLEQLTGVRLQIYCFMLQQDEPIGVRATQRALNLKSASHVSYHLTRMEEMGIVERTPSNLFFIREEYIIRSIRVNVLTEFFLLAGRFWPRSIFFAVYLAMSIIIGIGLVLMGNTQVLIIYFVISLVIALFVSIMEIRKQIQLMNGG